MGRGILLNCPLCRRGIGFRRLYGQAVCAKCFYKFTNRRQLAFLIDFVLMFCIAFYSDAYLLETTGWRLWRLSAWTFSATLVTPWVVLFMLRDGFGAPSPGKLATRIRVVDEKTRRPINLLQSLARNLVFLVGLIPVLGLVLFIAAALIDSMLLASGYRWGDRLAGTQVIWNRYAQRPLFGGDALACECCGYELTGNLSGVCPECGTSVSAANAARLGA